MCPLFGTQTTSTIMSCNNLNATTNDPALMLNLTAHRKPITSIVFNPNEETSFATASEDKSIMLWRIDSTTNVRCYSYKQHDGVVNDLDYLKNGKVIASCSNDKSVRLWGVKLQGATSSFKPHISAVNSVAFSQNGKILTGASDKCSKEYDLKTQRFLRSYVGHNHWVLCSRYASDTDMIASCSDDKTVRIWDSRVQENVHVFQTTNSGACKLAFNPSSSNPVLAVAMRSGSVRIYDLRLNHFLQHYLLHTAPNKEQLQHSTPSANVNTGCNSIAWHPSGAYLLTGGADNRLCIVDTLEGRPVYTLDDDESGVEGCGGIGAVAFSADGELFGAGGRMYIKIWKTNFISPPTLSSSSLIVEE